MNNQQQKKLVLAIIGLLILLIVFFSGSYVGQKNIEKKMLTGVIPEGIPVTAEQLEPFWKVWSIINEKFVTATTTDTEQRIWGAIQGLANSQGDPYTVFFPPEESKTFKNDISGNFEGVGMEIGIKDGILTVVSPLKGSPADRAGVRAGDKIIKIDDKISADLPVDKAVKMIRGQKGTSVKITFMRDGLNEPIDKVIVRDIINIPTIETEVKSGSSNGSNNNQDNGLRTDGIFVIKLFSFSAQSPELFRNALRSFLESGSHKLIIDLRGNPGGYLDAAWDMASWFLPIGKVIVTEDFGGKSQNKVYRSKGYDILNKFFGHGKYKILILVNSGSASAAEILSGALQEHGMARLIGTKTFGKGSVQELIEITPETSLKVTIARWLTPKGHNLSHDGLVPDIEVKVTQKDIDAKKDPQLDKAVEILRKEP